MTSLLLKFFPLLFPFETSDTIVRFNFNDSSVVNTLELPAPVTRQKALAAVFDLSDQTGNKGDSIFNFNSKVYHTTTFGAKPLGRVYYKLYVSIWGSQIRYELSNFEWKDITKNRYSRHVETIRGRRKALYLYNKRFSSSQKLAITAKINFELVKMHKALYQELSE